MAEPITPGVPRRFAPVTEIQRPTAVPRTEPPSSPPPKSRNERAAQTVVVQGHQWRVTAPIALIVAVGSIFAGRQTAPGTEQTQAILELRTETRADIAEIKRDIAAIREHEVRSDDETKNRLTVLELKAQLAAAPRP